MSQGKETKRSRQIPFFFLKTSAICASPKDANQLPRLKVREALLTNPGRHPIRFPHQDEKEQQMGSCDCQKVIWKWKAMRLVVSTVTQLAFPPFHSSFNELSNFTRVVPYQWCSYTACPFYLSHLKLLPEEKTLVHFSKFIRKTRL